MLEFTSKNGAKVKIELSSFKNAFELKNSIEKALLKENIDVANIDIDIGKVKENKVDFAMISSLSKYIMVIDSDENVHKSVFKCLERCLYNDFKITEETFEPEKARADYYEIVINCIKENLSPFLKTLFSELKEKQVVNVKKDQK